MADAYNRLLLTVACVVGDEDYCQIVPESLTKSELALTVRSVLRDQERISPEKYKNNFGARENYIKNNSCTPIQKYSYYGLKKFIQGI